MSQSSRDSSTGRKGSNESSRLEPRRMDVAEIQLQRSIYEESELETMPRAEINPESREQHANTLLVSLIEEKCTLQAEKVLSSRLDTAGPSHRLDVAGLSKVLFQETAVELQKAGLLLPGSESLLQKDSSGLREAYIRQLDAGIRSIVETHKYGAVEDSPRFGYLDTPRQLMSSASSIDAKRSDQGIMSLRNITLLPKSTQKIAEDGRLRAGISNDFASQYEQVELLGRGGYGRVYRMKHRLDGQDYAIKRIRITNQFLERTDLAIPMTRQCQALLDEVHHHSKLRHRNISVYHHCWMEIPRESFELPKHNLDYPLSHAVRITDRLLEENRISNSDHDQVKDVPFEISDCEQDENTDDLSAQLGRLGRISNLSNTSEADNQSIGAIIFEDSEIEQHIDNATLLEPLNHLRNESDNRCLNSTEGTESSGESPDCYLYIKQQLYEMTLQKYLSPNLPQSGIWIRHCYHVLPSVNILLALIDGLIYIHSRDIVHRDIKPANIFLQLHDLRDNSWLAEERGHVGVHQCPECNSVAPSAPQFVTPCIGDFGLAISTPTIATKTLDMLLDAPLETLAIANERPAETALYVRPNRNRAPPFICPGLDIYSLGIMAVELIMKFDTAFERADVLGEVKKGQWPEALRRHDLFMCVEGMLKDSEEQWELEQVKDFLERVKRDHA